MDAGPVDRGIRRIDFGGKFAGEDTVSRHEFVFEVCLMRRRARNEQQQSNDNQNNLHHDYFHCRGDPPWSPQR